MNHKKPKQENDYFKIISNIIYFLYSLNQLNHLTKLFNQIVKRFMKNVQFHIFLLSL